MNSPKINIYRLSPEEIIGRTLELAEKEIVSHKSERIRLHNPLVACNLIGGSRALNRLCEQYSVDPFSLSAYHGVNLGEGTTLTNQIESAPNLESVVRFVNSVIGWTGKDYHNILINLELLALAKKKRKFSLKDYLRPNNFVKSERDLEQQAGAEVLRLNNYVQQIDSVITPWKYYSKLNYSVEEKRKVGMMFSYGEVEEFRR